MANPVSSNLDEVERCISEAAPSHYILKIQSFSLLAKCGIEKYESGEFEAGGYKWKLILYPNGNKSRNVKEHLSLYLVFADISSLRHSCEVHAVFRFFLLDQTKDSYLMVHDAKEKDRRFHRLKHQWGFDQFIPIRTFNDVSNGYLLDDTCVFGAEVFVTKEMNLGKGECLSMIKDAISSKHVWKIENFSQLDSEYHESKEFFAGDQKWKVQLYPKGRLHGSGTHISMYLVLADSATLMAGSKIFAEFTLRIQDQQQSRHIAGKISHWFSGSSQESGLAKFVSSGYFYHSGTGCLVKDMCMVEAEAISVEGQRRNLQTDYVLKVLGLDICADIMVGNAMTRGISGGQRKRLTTGEMIVGPTKALFLDEISTGLDSSTTFQIVTYLQQLVHITDATAVVSLLQPAPETFNLFDDVLLMAEGKIVYHGPRSNVLPFFEDCGFKCPERKGVADFLQEVISKQDQVQYWRDADSPYNYVSVDQFSQMFKASYLGEKLEEELSKPFEKSQSRDNALSFTKYSLSKWQLFKACMDRELLLMKRNIFVYVFKTAQLVITAFMTMTVFTRTQMKVDLISANYLMGSMYYALIRLMTNGVAELSFTVIRLPIVYKQRAFYLYPPWAYSIPASILKIPLSLADSALWTAITYYVIGYSPEVQRFFCQFLLLFALHQASTSMCRFIASVFRTMVVATTVGTVTLVLMFIFGGFIIPRPALPPWLRWGFWLSPLTYGEIGISLNEFLAPRWQKVSEGNTTIGKDVLTSHGLNFDGYFYWISFGALLGFTVLFELGFILALTYLKPPKTTRTIISKKRLSQLHRKEPGKVTTQVDTGSTSVPQTTEETR